MTDITAILLTHNEELHIERCIRSLRPVAKKIFVVDSFQKPEKTEKNTEYKQGLFFWECWLPYQEPGLLL